MKAVSSDLSDRIYAARFLCVLCMMYVHVPNGMDHAAISYTFEFGRFDHWLEAFLIEGPGRAGAALLSVVSGYLVASSLMNSNGRQGSSIARAVTLYHRRFFSTILPMLFWGAVVLAVYTVVSQYRETFLSNLSGWLDHLNVVLFLTDVPYGPTMHLAFLRDLFVCVLIAPVLLWALNRIPLVMLLGLGFIYVAQLDISYFPVHRPLVLFSFCIGLYLSISNAPIQALDRYWPWLLSIAVFLALAIMWVNGGGLPALSTYLQGYGIRLDDNVLYPLCRLAGSLAIWTLLPVLLASPLGALPRRYACYLFAAFCSHHLVLTLVFHGAWLPLLGDRESATYILWFVTAPVLAMLLAWVLVRLVLNVSPRIAFLITGGRMKTGARLSKGDSERQQASAIKLAGRNPV